MAVRRAWPPSRAPRPRSTSRLSVATIAALIITLGVGAFGAWGTHSVVADQQRRLLKERRVRGRPAVHQRGQRHHQLAHGDARRASGHQRLVERLRARGRPAGARRQTRTRRRSALLAPAAGGFTVVSAAGPLLKAGQRRERDRAATFTKTRNTPKVVATPVMGSGSARATSASRSMRRQRSAAWARTCSTRRSALGKLSAGRSRAARPSTRSTSCSTRTARCRPTS